MGRKTTQPEDRALGDDLPDVLPPGLLKGYKVTGDVEDVVVENLILHKFPVIHNSSRRVGFLFVLYIHKRTQEEHGKVEPLRYDVLFALHNALYFKELDIENCFFPREEFKTFYVRDKSSEEPREPEPTENPADDKKDTDDKPPADMFIRLAAYPSA